MKNKKIQEILTLIEEGENSAVEFKSANVHPDSLAREITAFSNTLGGIILVGIEDDKQITGINNLKFEEWISNISRNNIIPAVNLNTQIIEYNEQKIGYIPVPKGLNKPYQTLDGKYWIRIGSTNRIATKEELSRLFQQAGFVHFDISSVDKTSIQSIDKTKVHDYYENFYQLDFLNLEEDEQIKLMLNADILEKTDSHEYKTTVGGNLLFGKQPQKYLPQSSIVFAAYKGHEITEELIDKKEITGTLPELIDKTISLIQLLLPKSSIIHGSKREEQERIPIKVLREVIVNAVSHRDYSIQNRNIMICLFQDRLEIISPGRLTNTLTLEKIKVGNSAIRNHFIVKYLENMRYIDRLGRGVPLIIKSMGERAEFSEEGEMFKVVLHYQS